MNITRSIFVAAAVTALASGAAIPGASAPASGELRCVQPENVKPSHGAQSVLARLRVACPLLGDIIEEFAAQDLGEAAPGAEAKPRREIAVVAAFAASGDTASMERHARTARAAGATKHEFEEVLYLTAVYAGVPKAIEATRALADLLAPQECSWSARIEHRHF